MPAEERDSSWYRSLGLVPASPSEDGSQVMSAIKVSFTTPIFDYDLRVSRVGRL